MKTSLIYLLLAFAGMFLTLVALHYNTFALFTIFFAITAVLFYTAEEKSKKE